MKHILFIVGPALGHVSRCLTIAREISIKSEHQITFLAVTPGYGEKLIKPEFPTITINYQGRGDCIFADGIESVLLKLEPDVVCVDLTPMKWLTLVRFGHVKTVYITNYFLTNLCGYQTIQQMRFNKQKHEINSNRVSRGLSKISNIKDLYDMDTVLLCDPVEFVSNSHQTNSKYHVVGSCYWEPKIELPKELESLKGILYVSLGSTGRVPIPKRMIDEITHELNIKDVVWLGAEINRIQVDSAYNNHYYSWLPATKMLSRSKFVISQGGSGSTYQALANGVPCGIWPSHKNQEIMGGIVESHGYGLLLKETTIIHEVLSNLFNPMNNKCKLLKKKISNYNGPLNAAKKIIELI